jgi:hypothetical protein
MILFSAKTFSEVPPHPISPNFSELIFGKKLKFKKLAPGVTIIIFGDFDQFSAK